MKDFLKKLRSEDWMAVFVGFAIIAIACLAVFGDIFDFSALKFKQWGVGEIGTVKGVEHTFVWEDLASQFGTIKFWNQLLMTFVVLGWFFMLAVRFMDAGTLSAAKASASEQGKQSARFLPAFIVLFILGIVVRIISAEYTLNMYLEWAFWALAVGLLISNTIGTPAWLRPAIRTEFYIKTGLVIMGFSVLFNNIAKFGLYGLGIAWLVTPLVIIFMWWFGTKVLKINNKPMVITMAAATSVCGTSAAIATGSAAKCKKEDLGMVISISIIFTILMMVFEPIVMKRMGVSEMMAGALIGGTVDSTGAVVAAGSAYGPEAETVAALVKSIQNILIGFIAFFVALFFAAKVDRESGATVGPSEIWKRFPKFIIGFFVASLLASFLFQPLFGSGAVKAVNGVLDQYKNWAFVLGFLCIGLDTNFVKVARQMQGGKTLWLYIVGQCFNIALTAFAVWVLLSGKFFPVPQLS